MALTSELDAVNMMLESIGEAPVSSLDDTGLADVALAKRILTDVSREVQEEGWHFNTEEEVKLTPDVSGYINIPTNTLRIALNEAYRWKDVVQRGTKMYDRENHTYVFSEYLKFDIVYLLTWEDLPQAARNYIAKKAGRIFQNKTIIDDVVYQFTKEDEETALDKLKKADEKNADYNFIRGNAALMR